MGIFKMADVHDSATRSYNMSRIRSKNTLPELVVRRWLFSKGFRYRIHVKDLPGRPDIVLPKYKLAIFTNGCFWHGHTGCKYFVIPKTRRRWWLSKIEWTKQLDSENMENLTAMGWKVRVIYECELKDNNLDKTLRTLQNELH
jgi:DNA mismatch endonuclease, patch repair protein